jgi:deoxycytidine triphosphate deaminase
MLAGQSLEDLAKQGHLFTNLDPSEVLLEPSSIDLRASLVIHTGDKGETLQHDLTSEPFKLGPGKIVTLVSREDLNLPKNVAGVMFAPNRVAECGIVAFNVGHIDPGYQGPVNLRVVNLGGMEYTIDPGMEFATVLLFPLVDLGQAKDTTISPRRRWRTRDEYVPSLKAVVARWGGATYKPPSEEIAQAVVENLPRILIRGFLGWGMILFTLMLLFLGIVTIALMVAEIVR